MTSWLVGYGGWWVRLVSAIGSDSMLLGAKATVDQYLTRYSVYYIIPLVSNVTSTVSQTTQPTSASPYPPHHTLPYNDAPQTLHPPTSLLSPAVISL